MPDVPSLPRVETRPRTWGAALLAILGIGWFDYASGIELRVFALYFAPISLVAWHFGRIDACVASVLCSVTWLVSNLLAGQQYSHPAFWVANTAVQTAAFVTVGLLIANLRAAIRRERGLSRTDALTDLLNTRAFYEDAGHILALCRRKGHPVTLAYIDLDDFKVVNDTRGHAAGDGLLRRVADALRTSTRPSDSCARLGGDEFAVLLPEVEALEATLVLERLRRRISDAGAAEGCVVTSSVGAVTFRAVPGDMDAMVAAADSQMYLAKAQGKDRLKLTTVGEIPKAAPVPTSP